MEHKFYRISLTRELNTKYFGWHLSLLSLWASYSTPPFGEISFGSSRLGKCPAVLSIMKFTPEPSDSFDNMTRCIGTVLLVAVQFSTPWFMMGRGQGIWDFLKITYKKVDNVIRRVPLQETIHLWHSNRSINWHWEREKARNQVLPILLLLQIFVVTLPLLFSCFTFYSQVFFKTIFLLWLHSAIGCWFDLLAGAILTFTLNFYGMKYKSV